MARLDFEMTYKRTFWFYVLCAVKGTFMVSIIKNKIISKPVYPKSKCIKVSDIIVK